MKPIASAFSTLRDWSDKAAVKRDRVKQAFEPNQAAALACIAMVVLNHSLFGFGRLHWFWTAVFALTVAVVAIVIPHTAVRGPGARLKYPKLIQIFIGLIVAAPVTVSFALSWNREFPFSGDHYFHVGQSFRMAYWWLAPIGSAIIEVPTGDDVRRLLLKPGELLGSRLAILALIGAATATVYRFDRRFAVIFAALALIAFGLAERTIFLRYPGGAYLLALPYLGPGWLLGNFELAGRLNSVAALLGWLFVLRPWIVGAWPDVRILPAAALLFWQKDVIYYFDSVYLEPWAVVFALLAVETLVDRGREGAPTACLLVGLAATVKEPMILALPFAWLAGAPWRGELRARVELTGAALAAGVPFVIYYAARKSLDFSEMGADRLHRLSFSYEGLAEYVTNFAHQMKVIYSDSGAIVILSALVLIPILLRRARDPLPLAAAISAGVGIIIFFALDSNTIRYAGYFRFLLLSLPFLVAGVILLGHSVSGRTAWLISIAVLMLQAPSAQTALARAAGPATDRNFIEHFDSPLVFPVRSLIRQAIDSGFVPADAVVSANLADAMIRRLPDQRVEYGPLGVLICRCTQEQPYILATFIRFTNQAVPRHYAPASPGERRWVWQQNRAHRAACIAEMRNTCSTVLERNEGGELVAALGARPKP